MEQTILLELQKALLSNEALMSNIYKRALGKPDLIAKEVSEITSGIFKYSKYESKTLNIPSDSIFPSDSI